MVERANTSRHSQRHSRNLEHLKKVQFTGAGAGSNGAILSSLRTTQLVSTTKSALPAELIALVLNFLAPDDLIRCARVSHLLQEMVYDDTRWVQKLKAIRVWNEVEARQRFEEAMKRRTKDAEDVKKISTGVQGLSLKSPINGNGEKPRAGGTTLFDAAAEEAKLQRSVAGTQQRRHGLADGFDEVPVAAAATLDRRSDPAAALNILDHVRSIRGHARQEFGRIYVVLAPLYNNLGVATSHANALVFQRYHDPEQQAQLLSNLKRFAQCDPTQTAVERDQKLDELIQVFENAVLQEFERGYAAGDIEGRMHRYAHVLVTLNGGSAGLESFISLHPVIARTMTLGDPLDCLEDVAPGHVDLNPAQSYFEKLAALLVKQAAIIDAVFPPSVDAFTPFLTRLCQNVVSEYLSTLFDVAHDRGIETYVKSVAGTFSQALRLVASLSATKASPSDFASRSKQAVLQCFSRHLDLYLQEELELFQTKSDADVSYWEKQLSEQEASTDSFFMSNINRQAAKRDFLSSFKKVVMMPVNALPISSPFASARPTSVIARSSANMGTMDISYTGARPHTPPIGSTGTPPPRSETPQQERPTTELAAKAAIMNSRLEGIKSLFSIDVALSLTHLAKASIERAAIMVQLGGRQGDLAKAQCEAIFVKLLDILGTRHVKHGFDRAVGHLGEYNPREVRRFREQSHAGELSATAHGGVEPLVTFLELVNLGDLIQQMVDVFFAQELIATKLTDRDDFLNPAVKEKKKFEQMLDERVAAGLNKGIDVLMDEVEFICATIQLPADFNPQAAKDGSKNSSSLASAAAVDIGPSSAAKQVVDVVSGHTAMLVGSTDKNMLDVFTQEVGLRLFGVLCKHFKRQRISVDGAIKLICDINHYSSFVSTLRQKPLQPYYQALREMSQIYLVHIDPPSAYFGSNAKGKRGSLLSTQKSPTALQAKELATIIADSQRYHGIFPTEEVYEFAQRRADWYLVKGDVERAMYGVGCSIM
jgi:recyclin-1